MLTLTLLLVVAAFAMVLLSKAGSPPRDTLWIAVLLLCLVHLLAVLPR